MNPTRRSGVAGNLSGEAVAGINDKVAFLSSPRTYPDDVRHVEIRQTHMSWVFLTDKDAWKLKKPVRTEYVDLSTPKAREGNCLREVRLNRRLAKDVYIGVEALTMDREGNFRLDGRGKIVDWLVHMRRLPADRMLDNLIACGNVPDQGIAKVASVLANFYAKLAPARMTPEQYRKRLAADLESARSDLTRTEYGVSRDPAASVIRSELEFLEENRNLFDARVCQGKIVEGHGDLRPEHVCLETQPLIIDCLEFNRSLRILDAASELAFLALECERLGAPEIGRRILNAYSEQADDRPANALLEFYRAYHACVRAKIAIWHLNDDNIQDRAAWVAKAEQYLRMAARMSKAA
jgi:aminoglycoside phosphotransferase family enzyme